MVRDAGNDQRGAAANVLKLWKDRLPPGRAQLSVPAELVGKASATASDSEDGTFAGKIIPPNGDFPAEIVDLSQPPDGTIPAPRSLADQADFVPLSDQPILAFPADVIVDEEADTIPFRQGD